MFIEVKEIAMTWKSYKEVLIPLNKKSVKTVQRMVKRGDLEMKEIPNPNGGRCLRVIKCDDLGIPILLNSDNNIEIKQGKESLVDDSPQNIENGQVDKWTSGNHKGTLVNGQNVQLLNDDSNRTQSNKSNVQLTTESDIEIENNEFPVILPKAENVPAIFNTGEEVPNLLPVKHISQKDQEIAIAKSTLCEYVIQKQSQLSRNARGKVKKQIIEEYNHELILEDVFALLGKISERTCYRWLKEYKSNNQDFEALAPKHHNAGRKRKVPEGIKQYIIKEVKKGNRVDIAPLIYMYITNYERSGNQFPCSPKTVTRWWNDFKDEHVVEYTLWTRGEKYFQEHYNKTILRDINLLEVGDIWISDGHVLANKVINPATGKAERPILVAWFDMKSRMPVGAAIDFTENKDVIHRSLRNSILNTGYAPKIAYIDNGKAYVCQDFMGKKNVEWKISLDEIQGMYARLGIKVVNSLPYNAKAKTIERWWLTMQQQLERFIPQWLGSKIHDKPARLARNEKWVKKFDTREAYTVSEWKHLMQFWVMELYGKKPTRVLDGQTPLTVHTSATIASNRIIEPNELNYLMLTVQKKRMRNQGIYINKLWYWHETLIPYVGKDVLIRQDDWDIRSILVSDDKDKLICQAVMRKLQHPMYHLAEDKPLAKKELQKEIAEIKRVEKNYRKSAEEFAILSDKAIDPMQELLASSPHIETQILEESPSLPEPVFESSEDEEEDWEIGQMDTISANNFDSEEDELDIGINYKQ